MDNMRVLGSWAEAPGRQEMVAKGERIRMSKVVYLPYAHRRKTNHFSFPLSFALKMPSSCFYPWFYSWLWLAMGSMSFYG